MHDLIPDLCAERIVRNEIRSLQQANERLKVKIDKLNTDLLRMVFEEKQELAALRETLGKALIITREARAASALGKISKLRGSVGRLWRLLRDARYGVPNVEI